MHKFAKIQIGRVVSPELLKFDVCFDSAAPRKPCLSATDLPAHTICCTRLTLLPIFPGIKYGSPQYTQDDILTATPRKSTNVRYPRTSARLSQPSVRLQ